MLDILGPCVVDLFASTINAPLLRYVSWLQDSEAWTMDAFTLQWKYFSAYCFPTFSLIPGMLQKLELNKATCILVAPLWRSQSWFTKLQRLLVDLPILFPRKPDLFIHPASGDRRPLCNNIRLIACSLSGKLSSQMVFQRRLWT